MNDSIPVSQLTPAELQALEGTDRIQGGFVQVPPLLTTPAPMVELAINPADVPEPSPEVIAAAQALSQAMLNPEIQQEDPAEVAEKKKQAAELDADKTAFLAHVLGAERFIKSYSFYGGQIIFSFHTLTGGEHEACIQLVQSEELPEPKRIPRLMELLMFASVHEVIRVTGTLDNRMQLPAELLTKSRALKDLPGAVYHLLRASFERFSQRTMDLTALAESPDFWTAAPAV